MHLKFVEANCLIWKFFIPPRTTRFISFVQNLYSPPVSTAIARGSEWQVLSAWFGRFPHFLFPAPFCILSACGIPKIPISSFLCIKFYNSLQNSPYFLILKNNRKWLVGRAGGGKDNLKILHSFQYTKPLSTAPQTNPIRYSILISTRRVRLYSGNSMARLKFKFPAICSGKNWIMMTAVLFRLRCEPVSVIMSCLDSSVSLVSAPVLLRVWFSFGSHP